MFFDYVITDKRFKFECPICWEYKKYLPNTYLCFTCLRCVCVDCNRSIKLECASKCCPNCRGPRIITYEQIKTVLRNLGKKINTYNRDYNFFIYDKIGTIMVNKDRRLAKKCFRYAAEQNYPPAQAKLGFLLIKEDIREAIDWLSLASCWCVPIACFQMGNSYFSRWRYRESEQWYLKSAKKGHIASYEMLYILYDIFNDKENKTLWYRKLVINGRLPTNYRKIMIKIGIKKPLSKVWFLLEN